MTRNDRFIQQARAEYAGEPRRIARCRDDAGEEHVIIEMKEGSRPAFWLDWIGAELAEEPDEWDELPFSGLKWKKI